jgi:hypothetical protein
MGKLIPTAALLGGMLFALNGAFYTIGLVPRFGTSHTPIMVDVIGLLALGIVPLGLGLGGIWYGQRRLRQMKQAAATQRHTRIEQSILQAARSRPQGVTLEDVMGQTSYKADDVKATLEKLYLDGKLEMDVTEQGHLVYKLRAVS